MLLQEIRLEEIRPSPTNPRKTFDPVKLEELAQSIAEKGLIQPIVVRPHQNGDGARFEIIAGERRFRASRLAGLDAIPCMVRELDDVAVLELQTIENLQRDDLHALEEAEGYAELMKAAGYAVEDIARKVGKSKKYVYDRVKLLQLIPAVRKVFVDGEITAGHAILLARLSGDEQKRAIGMHSDEPLDDSVGFGGLFQAEQVDDPGLELDDKRKAVSVRELETWINKHVRFRPEAVDLPNLFPDTARALEQAAEAELKVVKITHNHQLLPETRADGERTYSRPSWKRADGEIDHGDWSSKRKPSKTCEHAVMGVVVAGPDRGQAFPVCIAKKKCEIHWKAEQEAANERGAPNGAGTKKGKDNWQEQQRKQQEKWKAEREREEAERKRWVKALKSLKAAALEALEGAEGSIALDLIEERLAGWGGAKKLTAGTLEERLKQLARKDLLDQLAGPYPRTDTITRRLKRLGVDAKKIVDEVAPKPKAEKKPKASKGGKEKGGARARRRAKRASADVSTAAAE